MRFEQTAQGFGAPLVVAVAALFAITLFRIVSVSLNGTDLYIDESQYWAWSNELDFGYYSKPPLLAWIIAVTTELCGNGEACVRMPSVFIHLGTSLVVFAIAAKLYDRVTALWASLSFATLPGISVSSQIISTDVPLLLAWACALYLFVVLVQTKTIGVALLLGVVVGVGLNAKYAMAYFVLCGGLFLILSPNSRPGLGWRHLIVGMLPVVLLLVPNIMWNIDHDFSTVSHTADNAKWGGPLFHPGKALEFFGAQFGVFGPILFFVLLTLFWRFFKARDSLSDADRLLLAFILPILIIVTLQSFLSRAHANWAAPSYVAASVLVPAWMLRDGARRWLYGSLAIGFFVLLAISAGTTFAGRYALPGGLNPYGRALGFEAMAAAVAEEVAAEAAAGKPPAVVVSRRRGLTTALLYYGRNLPVPVAAWRAGGVARDHFQLTRPFRGTTDGSTALVVDYTKAKNVGQKEERDITRATKDLEADCNSAEFVKSRLVTADRFAPKRKLHFFRCSGYRAQ